MLAGLAFADRLDVVSERLRFKGIAPDIQFREVLDTPYQHLILAGDAPSYLYSGGQYSGTFPDPWSVEMLAHQVACMAPHPSRVFVLGAAARGSIRFLLQHPVREITLVEPDTRALVFLREHLPAEDRRALDDSRVRIVAEDPRRFLTRTPASFDLIFLQSPEPVTLLGARLSTREFFRHCASRLSAEGVLVLPVRTAPAGLTGETEALAGSLFSALVDAFPVVRATPGPESLFVAGHDSNVTTLEPDILAGRWAERRLVSDVFTGELFAASFPPDRVRETEESLRAAARLFPESSDDRSLSFSHALLRRQSETASSPGSALLSLGRLPASLLAGLALLPSALSLLARRRAGSRDRGVFHSVAAAGATGMAVSLVLLFSYQTCEGALYGELGALTSLFMLGLAIGAGATRGRMSLRTSLSVVLFSTAAIALSLPLLPLVSSVGFLASLSAHGGLLLLAGGATGSVFPAAATFLASEGACARDAAARMETADHVGASFAALGASVIFVPALGMRGTAWLSAGIVVLGRLAVWRLGRP
jgi:spermidine synthase